MDYTGYLRALSQQEGVFRTQIPVLQNGELHFEERNATEEDERMQVDLLARYIHTGNTYSAEDRVYLYDLAKKVNVLPQNSQIRQLFQNSVIGTISDTTQKMDIHCLDAMKSEYLQTLFLGSFSEACTGEVIVEREQFLCIQDYLMHGKDEISLLDSDIHQLINFSITANYLGFEGEEEKILSVIEKKLETMSLEDLISLLKDCGGGVFHKVTSLIGKKIGSYAPLGPEEMILHFYNTLYEDLGESAIHLSSLSFKKSVISTNILDHLSVLFPNITSLDMVDCNIDDDRMQELVASLSQQGWGNLIELNVSKNQLGEEGARCLAALMNLESLNIAHNDIGSEGARCLAALMSLHNLNIGWNHIGTEGARSLAALMNLRILNVSENFVGAEGARCLSALINLEGLNIAGNNIRNEGAVCLVILTNLKALDVSDNELSIDELEYLRTAIGGFIEG